MENKHVIDRRTIKLENILKDDYIPMGAGKPERETVIGLDDIANLKIALNTFADFEQFIKSV